MEPADVTKTVVSKLESLRAEFNYGDKSIQSIAEIARKPNPDNGFAPPYFAVAYVYDLEGQELSGGHVHKLPVTIIVLCGSSPGYTNETESLREAVFYARKVVEKLVGELIVNVGTEESPVNELVFLKAAKKPIEILEADPELSIVASYLQYEDKI